MYYSLVGWMNPKVYCFSLGDWVNEEIKKEMEDYLTTHRLGNVAIESHQDDDKLLENIVNCYFVVVPSLWYENQPYSVLETLVMGKVVLASRIGGIPEMIDDGKTGLMFSPGDVKDCRKKITALWNNPKLVFRMENEIRLRSKVFGPETHYKKLISIYKKAISLHE